MYDAIATNAAFRQTIIHSGQHISAQMNDVFFEQLSIPSPDVQLKVETASPDEFIGVVATQMASVLQQYRQNDLVLIYGDTNTTLAGALAARRSNKKLLHFEAGVRTNDTSMPEEINRILCDRLSDVHYCCTQKNVDNLIAEGYGLAISSQVILSGDLMLDAFLKIKMSDKKITSANQYIACTIHRAANITDAKNVSQIVAGLNAIHKETEVVVPLHPHTAKRLREFAIQPQFTVIEPLGYTEMKRFLSDAAIVITDSGGASREAYFAKKKSLIIMEHPFWMEIVEANAALHCGANAVAIKEAFQALSSLQPRFENSIFGDGTAALKIAQHLNLLA